MRLAIATIAILLALPAGCGKHKTTAAPSPRIVTLAPSITEMAFDMGLGDHVVGVDKYSVLPEGQKRTVVSDAFQPNSEAILAEEPDIVFYNQKDSDFDALRRLKPSVQLIRLRNDKLADLRASVMKMGEAMKREDLAKAMLQRIDADMDAVVGAVAGKGRPRVLFVLGIDHPSTAGLNTWMDELIGLAGGTNLASQEGVSEWRDLNVETILKLRPDVLICLTPPGEQNKRTAREYWMSLKGLPAVQNGRVYVTDNQAITIAGSKVGQTAREIAGMIHPEAFVPAASGPATSNRPVKLESRP